MYRLYRQEQLAVRRRKRKKLAATARVVLPVPPRPNERSSMDFMSDTLATGRAFRTLNIVDDASRECLVIEVDHGLASLRVIRVLEQLAATRGLPRQIVVDNVLTAESTESAGRTSAALASVESRELRQVTSTV